MGNLGRSAPNRAVVSGYERLSDHPRITHEGVADQRTEGCSEHHVPVEDLEVQSA
jgi:hypothetical protein